MPTLHQDLNAPRSKASTRFSSESAAGTWAVLADDQSQWLGDATAGAGSMTLASPESDRLNLSHPRTITVRAECTSTSTGVFFRHGSAGDELRFDIAVAGTLRAYQNGAAVGTLAIPGLTGSRAVHIFAWASRPNPRATGASDAVQSWLYSINVAGGQVARAEFFHAAKSGGGATATWGTYSANIFGFSHEARCQSLTEIAIDWGVHSPVAPRTRCSVEPAPLPVELDSTLGDELELYGPVPAWAALHSRHAQRRTWSPLANEVYRTQDELEIGTAPGPHYRLAPGDDEYWMRLGWLVPVPVPPGCTHAWVRLHARSWVASGAAVPVGLRVVSMSRRPDFDDGTELVHEAVTEIVTRDDAASGGEWCVEQLLELAVGDDGWTYLCPAYAFDPASASANDANARLTIRALVAAPAEQETGGQA